MSIVGVNTIWCENCGRKHKSYRLIGIKLRMCFCVGIFRMKLPGLSQEKCFLHHLHALQSGRSLSQCWVLIGQVLNGRCWCQSKEQVLQQQCYHGNRGATTKIDQFDWQVQSFLDQNSRHYLTRWHTHDHDVSCVCSYLLFMLSNYSNQYLQVTSDWSQTADVRAEPLTHLRRQTTPVISNSTDQ